MTNSRLLTPLLAALILPLLASCQTPITATERAELAKVRIVGDICQADWMQAIRYSGKGDTELTKEQVIRFNAGRNEFCR